MVVKDSKVPAHWAAGSGHEDVSRLLQQMAPETLSAAASNGRVLAHNAAVVGVRYFQDLGGL